MDVKEVPSPIDLKNPQDALVWANEVNEKRLWRYEFFDYYVDFAKKISQKMNNENRAIHLLEIGSGPGFLAKHLLTQCGDIQYTAADFSEAMHALSKSKLSANELQRTEYILCDFKTAEWRAQLAQYDVVIIHQALHELRHKHYATQFHQEVKSLLKPQAVYFVCDHIFAPDAMKNNELYMSQHEHFQALKNAGFNDVALVKEIKGLGLFECYV